MSGKFKFDKKNGVTEKFFEFYKGKRDITSIFQKWGEKGVKALSAATPVSTGETASSWSYEIEKEGEKIILYFLNDVVVGQVALAALLQTGHLSKSGSFVAGIDYINPALEPIVEGLQNDIYKELSFI